MSSFRDDYWLIWMPINLLPVHVSCEIKKKPYHKFILNKLSSKKIIKRNWWKNFKLFVCFSNVCLAVSTDNHSRDYCKCDGPIPLPIIFLTVHKPIYYLSKLSYEYDIIRSSGSCMIMESSKFATDAVKQV